MDGVVVDVTLGYGAFMKNEAYTVCMGVVLLFFFSSRRRHTRFKCDWSSDVCSSDLVAAPRSPRSCSEHKPTPTARHRRRPGRPTANALPPRIVSILESPCPTAPPRSEERRVGKEGRSRWSPYP